MMNASFEALPLYTNPSIHPPCIHPPIHPSTHPLTDPPFHLLIQLPILPFSHPLIYLFTQPPTYPLSHPSIATCKLFTPKHRECVAIHLLELDTSTNIALVCFVAFCAPLILLTIGDIPKNAFTKLAT